MIDFENVNKSGFLYRLLHFYIRIVHNCIYYRQYYVVNRKNIPPKGEPFIMISNHQNGLNDALGMIFSLPDGRYPVFIARADIFKKDFIAKLLRFIQLLPAFRMQDVGKEKLAENAVIFNKSAEILAKDNGVIGIFPEAGHQDCRHLGTFKKGFARIAFKAVEMSDYKLRLKILPVSNHYSNYYNIQGKLVVTIGEPFEFTELYEIYKQHPEKAQYLLAQKARERVKELMLDIENMDTYVPYDTIRQVYCKELLRSEKKSVYYFPNQLWADKKIVAALDRLRESDVDTFNKLMKIALQYGENLKQLRLRDWIFRRKLNVWGFWMRFILIVISFPLFLYGLVHNIVPFSASNLITGKVKDNMLHASLHLGIGALVTFPLWYVLLTCGMYAFTGSCWISLLYFGSLPVSLFIFFRSKVLLIKLYNRCRRFFLLCKKNPTLLQTQKFRDEMTGILHAVVQ